MRPRKITDDKLGRLIGVAKVRLEAEEILSTIPGGKQLAYEIGITPNYLHNVMHRLTSILRTKQRVPHETLRAALLNDEKFKVLMEKLTKEDQRVVRLRGPPDGTRGLVSPSSQ